MTDIKIREFSKRYLSDIKQTLNLIETDLLEKVEAVALLLEETKTRKGRIFIMGNGGSASTSSHFSEDLAKGTIVGDSLRFKTISLSDSMPAILAWANDSSYDDIFVEQLKNLMEQGDVVIGLSGSGNSKNVIKAIEYANQNGAKTIGFSGYDGGRLIKCASINIRVPSFNMQKIEDVHMIVVHILVSLLFEREKTKLNKITMNKEEITSELKEHVAVVNDIILSKTEDIQSMSQLVIDSYKKGGKLIIFGNGGSAADAQHIVAELAGRYKMERDSLEAVALTVNTSIMTAIGNDYGFDRVFEKQIEGIVKENDVVIGISTSGNTENVLKAILKAKEKGAKTIGWTGLGGGKLKDVVDVLLDIPTKNTPRIQESHIAIGHIMCGLLEKELFGNK